MSNHEMIPEDDERLSRLEYQNERFNKILSGDKSAGKTGLMDDVREMRGDIREIKDLIKGVRTGFKYFGWGVGIGGLVFGIYTVKEIIALFT